MPISSLRIHLVPPTPPTNSATLTKPLIPELPKVSYSQDPCELVRQSLLGWLPQQAQSQEHLIPLAYCSQILTDYSTVLVHTLLTSLHRFHLRGKRRLVSGIRESLRQLQSAKVQLLIVAVDVDDASRGLEWREMLQEAKKRIVPIVYCLRRQDLAGLLNRKGGGTQVVAVTNADGAYQIYQELVEFSLTSSKEWLDRATEILVQELGEEKGDMLHVLAYFGHLGVIKKAAEIETTKFKSIVNYVSSKNGCSPLMFACNGGWADVAEYLIESGANINSRDFYLRNTFHHCALSSSKECLELLLSHCHSNRLEYMLAKDNDGMDVLSSAIAARSHKVIELVLKANLTPTMDHLLLELSSSPPDSKTFRSLLVGSKLEADHFAKLIMNCSKIGSLDCLRCIFAILKNRKLPASEISKLVNDHPEQGQTSLWWAAYLGHVGVARELISNGADEAFSFEIDSRLISASNLLDKRKEAARNQ